MVAEGVLNVVRPGSVGQAEGLFFEEVADFLEEDFLAGWGRRGSRGGCGGGAAEGVDDFDQDEDAEHEEKETDEGVDEVAVGEDGVAGIGHGFEGGEGLAGFDGVSRGLDGTGAEGEVEVFEVGLADAEGDDGHDDVFDHGVDHGGKGATDDDADGEVKSVAAGYEFFEFFDETGHGGASWGVGISR